MYKHYKAFQNNKRKSSRPKVRQNVFILETKYMTH